ncbi:MAG: hypothetical protein ACREBQ_01050 [Nitrososphaerales archaeon]
MSGKVCYQAIISPLAKEGLFLYIILLTAVPRRKIQFFSAISIQENFTLSKNYRSSNNPGCSRISGSETRATDTEGVAVLLAKVTGIMSLEGSRNSFVSRNNPKQFALSTDYTWQS